MKTNQIMIRQMGEFTVSQRTKDGYFDAGELLRQWNLSGQEQRKMEVFLNSVSTCKFIEALIAEANEVGLGQNCPKPFSKNKTTFILYHFFFSRNFTPTAIFQKSKKCLSLGAVDLSD